ncbi:541_t:CDS:10 [Entrophospora sp. SA101]|nr:541_t:CDS:10 [Entrophospora sp. SA101]
MSLAISIIIIVVLTEMIVWFGYSQIASLAYSTYLSIFESEALTNQRKLKRDILIVKQELARTSSQTSFEIKFKTILWTSANGIQIIMVLWYRTTPVFYLPEGWFTLEEYLIGSDQGLINSDNLLPTTGLRRIRDKRSMSCDYDNRGEASKIMNHIDLARFSTESLHSYSFVRNDVSSFKSRQNFINRSIDFMKNKIKGWKIPIHHHRTKNNITTQEEYQQSPSSSNQAIITTDDQANILNANDLTCLLFGYSRVELLNVKVLSMIGSPFREKIAKTLVSRLQNDEDNCEAVLACGKVIPIQRKSEEASLASLWLKMKKDECGNFVLIWIFEEISELTMTAEIDEKKINKTKFYGSKSKNLINFPIIGEISPSSIKKEERQELEIQKKFSNIIYEFKIVSIPTIAGVITAYATGVIQSCNSDFVKCLFGVSADELIGKKNIGKLLPQFPGLVKILESESALVEGIVISENIFPDNSNNNNVGGGKNFLSINNNALTSSQGPSGIIAVHRDGTEFDVDIQMRILESPDQPLHALWITYDRNPPSTNSTAAAAEPFDPNNYSALTLKKTIDDFVITGVLGKGAYGEVKLAYYKNDPEMKKVVLKYVFKSCIIVDCWIRDKILGTVPLEIHLLHTLKLIPHPNIVQMVDFFEDDDNYYIEMGLHGVGMDLFGYIELNPQMPESEIKLIFLQVAKAIQHLHHNKIVHRDIKDENIILDEHNNVQIIDFGSGAYVKEDTKFDTFCGTIDYISPEVFSGKKYDGPPQDIWALGVLLYTLIYKENPFYNIDEVMARDLRIPFILSEGSIDLVKKMLEYDVDKRLKIDEVLSHPWLCEN